MNTAFKCNAPNTMLLEITHDTRYAYDPNVEIAQHFAHLKPANLETQKVLNSTIEVNPRPSWREENQDSYGNICTFFSLQNRHSELLITAKSLIETSGVDHGPKNQDTPAWELVREYFRYHSNTKWDAASEFLFTSPFITLRPEFAEFARANFTAGRPVLDAAIDLMKRIYSEFHYVSKSTDINTPALEALNKREGVCQDFAHILIASLRSIGIPAKYMSGYILTNPAPGQARLIGGDASHAWASVYVPSIDENGILSNGVWCDLDPDVSPIRGVIHGGADHTLDVAVTVMPIGA
jgi:transglutaminase-like putative cysteine protease